MVVGWYFAAISGAFLIGTLLSVAVMKIQDALEWRAAERSGHQNPKVRDAYEATKARLREEDRAAGL